MLRLDDPEQLLWVHCAEVGSYVNICRRCGIGAAPGAVLMHPSLVAVC